MDEILNQLGGLALGSVPTMILFLLLVAAYGLLVRRPMARVLAERRSRTTGAMERAHASISEAEDKMAAYEEKLHAVRTGIFAERERRMKQWSAERDRVLSQARSATAEKVKVARREIAQDMAIARLKIEGVNAELSERILRAVMPAGTRPEATR